MRNKELTDTVDRWEQEWQSYVKDITFRYQYLVETILRQRKKIKELEFELHKRDN